MKYGAHVFLWQDQFTDDDLARILDSATKLELDFVEVPVGDDIHFDPDLLRQRMAARGLELILSPGGVWPVECDISLPPNGHQKGVEWHCRAIDLTAKAGASTYAGALFGHPGTIRRGKPCNLEHDRVVAGLQQLADHAAKSGIDLVLEPMSHFRTHVANTPAQINRIVADVDRNNVFTLLDTYHLTTEVTDLAAAFEEMLPHLWGIHACENNRGIPGTGFLPWQKLGDAIANSGWDGHIGFESYNSQWRDGNFACERGMFHKVCPDGDDFVQRSRSFVAGLLSR